MEDQTVVAAPSAADADVFNGENVSFEEFSHFRKTGEVPDRFKPAVIADPAPAAETPQASSEGDQPETASDSEPEQKQQEQGKGAPKRQTAEDRIAQLEATIEKIKRGAGLNKTETASSSEQPKPQQAPPQTYPEWRKAFKPSEWIADYAKQNPEASYEDATAAMADHLGDVRDQFRHIEQQRESQAKEINAKIADARARYGEKFDEVLQPTIGAILQDKGISPAVKEMLNDSDVAADLIYTIGSDEKTLSEFLLMAKNNPTKAMRYIAVVENGIVEELSSSDTARNEKGQFTKTPEPPAKPKTSAPKPPSPVTGPSTGAFDVNDESLSPEAWAQKRMEQLAKRKV